MGKIVAIGICGGSASGKTRLSRELCNAFQGRSTLITQDDYYHDSSMLSQEEKEKKNYDHPDSIELERLYENLKGLKDGLAVEAPVYCFESHGRLEESKTVEPTQLIFVEGLYVFELPLLRDMLDLKVFLKVDSDIRLIRRVVRDIEERGRTIQSVFDQYVSTVRPMHEEFIEPVSRFADIVVSSNNEKDIDLAVDRLSARICELIAGAV